MHDAARDRRPPSFDDAIQRIRELLKQSPASAELRRRLGITFGYLANVQIDQKQPARAVESLAQAIVELSALQSADPSNARTAPELSYMLNQRARILMALDRGSEARSEAGRALALARAAAERPGAGGDALNEYAWGLVSAEPTELRNPAEALIYARRALERAWRRIRFISTPSVPRNASSANGPTPSARSNTRWD